MRVTKTVKEYIEKRVREKVYKKYEPEKEESERQIKDMNNFWEKLEKELEEIARKKIEKFISQNDFVKGNNFANNVSIIKCFRSTILLKDKAYMESVHNWRSRAEEEVKEKVTEIIVTLELGGDKKDLEKIIDEI